MDFLRFYSYMMSSIILFVGVLIAIPVAYNMNGVSTVRASNPVNTITVNEIHSSDLSENYIHHLDVEVTFLS